MATFLENVKVKTCVSCPFYSVEGMEHMMYCNHPYWKDKDAYAGAIITYYNSRNRVPDECPLRNGTTTKTVTVSL